MNSLKTIFLTGLAGLWFACWPGCIGPVFAAEMPQTEFRTNPPGTGTYKNDTHLDKELSIPGAEALEVIVTGETEEKYDILRIYNENMEEVRRLSGDFSDLRPFVVRGSWIKVTFNSDNRTVKKGAVVSIKAASPARPFREIKQKVIETVERVTSTGAEQANRELVNHTSLFSQLRTDLEKKTKIEGSEIRRLTGGLLAVADSYAKIAGLHDKVMEENEEGFERLKILGKRTLKYKQNVQDWKYNEETELAKLMAEIANERDETARRKKEISIQTKQSIIGSLDTQIQIWQDFYNTQGKIQEKLKLFTEKVGLLLYTLQMNAQVYRQAATVLQLNGDIRDALATLNSLSTLESVLGDIKKSWDEVENMKNELVKTQFPGN